MKILAIETSTMAGSLALADGGELVSEYLLNIKVTHSERLVSAIDTLLKDARTPISDIDCFALSLGPGSFTGLRIGVSTIKGLAFATNKPVVGIPTLDALAQNVLFSDYLICPILDARKKEVYSALYKRVHGGKLRKLTADLAIKPRDLTKKIEERVVFLGDGIDVYKELIKEELGDLAVFAPLNLKLPRAASVAKLGLHEFEKNNVLNVNEFTPFYVRLSEAEQKFNERAQHKQ